MIFSCVILLNFLCLGTKAQNHNKTLLNESKRNYTQQIWHSYTFDSGIGNREELNILRVALATNVILPNNVYQWKTLQAQGETIIVGLGDDFVLVTPYTNKNDTEVKKEAIEGKTKSMTVFQKWDAKAQVKKNFVVVAVRQHENTEILKWYTIDNRQLKFLCDWPYHKNISHIDVVKMQQELKLLIVSSGDCSMSNTSSIDIYSFSVVPKLDMWLLEKIHLNGTPSSVTVFSDNDNTYLAATQPQAGVINLWRYSRTLCTQSGEKRFKYYQRISSDGARSATAFQVGFLWHLAVAGLNSTIYRMGENLAFTPIKNFDLGLREEWLKVPIDTYREDVILLSRSDQVISAFIWNGNEKFQYIKNFTSLICQNDLNCSTSLNSISFRNTATFSYNNHQNILTSATDRTPFLIKLRVTLRPLPDKVSTTINDLIKFSNNLKDSYAIQVKEVEMLRAIHDKIAGNRTESDSSQVVDENDGEKKPKTMSQTKNWSDTLVALEILKSRMDALKESLDDYINGTVTLGLPVNQSNSSDSDIVLDNLSEGIVFDGKIIINNLNVSIINGHNVNDLLKNSYRRDRDQKIEGLKTFESVDVGNLVVDKINNVPACEIVFSDDPWEVGDGNVIHGDLLFEGKVNIMNDIKLTPGEKMEHVQSPRNYETFSNLSKHTFDELYFQDLEITNESLVLHSINSRPMILPVHSAPTDIRYLNMVNQARIEVVNVLENLTVDEMNGRNFTELMNQIILKNNNQGKEYESVKIDGVLRVQTLEPQNLNSVPLARTLKLDNPRTSDDEPKWKMSQNAEKRTSYKPKSNPNEKLKIYVFKDLKIDGILYANEINNLGWKKLNNTLRKGVPGVVTGVKTFTAPLKVPRLEVDKVNGEDFVEKIMTDSTEQVIEYPQTFAAVHFNDLLLNGTWDGIDVEKLNRSLLRAGSDNRGNLTIANVLEVENLHVTDAINNVDLNKQSQEEKKNALTGSKKGFKWVKASTVVVKGSLNTNHNLNNVNLTHLDNLRVSVKKEQTVERDITQSNLTLEGNLMVNKLNGNDVASVVDSHGDDNVIDHFLNGHIRGVKKLLVKGNISTDEGINNHNLSVLLNNGVYVGEGSVIKGNIIFEDIVNFKELNITNTVDGLSLKALGEDVVLKHSHVFLSGTKTFSKLKVLKDMKAKYLNGHLIQDVVTLMGDHEMKGSVKINGNVIIKSNLTATGAINNVAIPPLLKTYSTEFDSYISMDDLDLDGDSLTIRNVLVEGTIQNVYFDDVLNDAVFIDDCCNITAKKTFLGQVNFMGNLTVEDSINGVKPEKLAEEIILVDRANKIGGRVFLTEAILNSISVSEYFNSSLINDFDLNDWLEESVPLDRREVINGKMIFEKPESNGNIDVDLINGHMSSAIITLKGKQFIPVLGLFQKLNVTSDVSVGGTVNGYNLLKEYENTVLSTGDQTINNKLIFHKDFIVEGDLEVNNINGKSLEDLIILDTEQTIEKSVNFNGTVTIRGNINKLKFINGINLKSWNERSVFLNRPQEIYGHWETSGVVKAQNVEGNAVLNDVVLTDVANEVEKGRVMTVQKKEETEMEYHAHCQDLGELSEDLSKLPYLFHQFDVTQVIETQSIVESVVSFKIADSDYLMISFSNECYSAMYKWDKSNTTYRYVRHVNIGPISKWLVVYRNNVTYLVTSFTYGTVECEENRMPGNIWVFQDDSEKYVHLMTSNGFVDIVQENETSQTFFTLEENGFIYQWTIKSGDNVEDLFLVNIGLGSYRFVDFKVFDGLAVTNGREVKEIKLVDRKIIVNHFSLVYGNIVALPVNGKTLVGVVLKDKIVVYENLREEKVFSVVQTYRANSVVWFNYGNRRQSFLIVSSHHKLVEIFEYRGVSGFVKRMSLQLFSMRLQAVSLPLMGKHQLGKFVIVIQKNKLIFLKADMLGDFYEKNHSFC